MFEIVITTEDGQIKHLKVKSLRLLQPDGTAIVIDRHGFDYQWYHAGQWDTKPTPKLMV